MIRRTLFLSAMLSAAVSSGALAQDAAAKGLTIELNALAPSEKGCMFTFVAENGLAANVSKVSYQVVIFNTQGTVERMASFPFGELPAGKSRVRQFDVPSIKCDAVKNLLINDAPVCEGDGVSATACMDGIVTRTKVTAGLEG